MTNNTVPVISIVLTVYNKAPILPDVVASLACVNTSVPVEWIFVDDHSTDGSAELLAHLCSGHKESQIIVNTENRGPSIRLNQGARAARGEWLVLIDGDDFLAPNAPEWMYQQLISHQADVFYGGIKKTSSEPKDLIGKPTDLSAPIFRSETPFSTVLSGKFVRMSLMVKRDLFLEAGGADERIFIQDESIPLRLSYRSQCWLYSTTPIVWIIDPESTKNGTQQNNIAKVSHLSESKIQQQHDRFLAYYHLYRDTKNDEMDCRLRSIIIKRAISAYWKLWRTKPWWNATRSVRLIEYILYKTGILKIKINRLDEIYYEIMNIQSIHRTSTDSV
jgi:glycosyltransferase involved in cell wall biosynthesis